MNGNSNAYMRPGTAYLALRAILGKDNYNAVLHHIQEAYRGGSMTEDELEKPSSTSTCPTSRPPATTSSTSSSSSGGTRRTRARPAAGNKPPITGPGLAGGGFYDADGGCAPYGIDVPGDGRRHGAARRCR